MGIEKTIEKICVQDAVYWGNPKSDGMGGYNYDAGIEIKCRWDDKKAYSKDKGTTDTGKELQTKSEILVTRDLQIGGYIYLGTIEELNLLGFSSIITEFRPNQINDAYEIKGFDKIPMIKKKNVFIRKAYL